MWSLADGTKIPANTFIRWRETTYPNQNAEDLARLRAIVGDKPDHPLRRNLERLERQLTVAPDGRVQTLWYEHEKRFRLSSSFSEGMTVEFNDTVVDGDLVWRLTDRSLHLFALDDIPEGENPYSSHGPLRSYLMYFFHSGFGSGPAGIRPISVDRDGSSWMCIAEFADGRRRFRRTGEILTDPDGERETLRVTLSEVVAAEDKTRIGAATLFLDWRLNSYVGREIPHRVETTHPDGTLRFVVELIEFRPLEPGELDGLLHQPEADWTDPIRGSASFTSIYDSRSGSTYISGDDDEFIRAMTTRDDPNRAWTYVLIGGVISVFILVAIRIRCHRT